MRRGSQDAAEFLQHLLDSVETELLSRPGCDLNQVNPVGGVFDGWMKTTGKHLNKDGKWNMNNGVISFLFLFSYLHRM